MAVLAVDVQANLDKLVALRDEIRRLENELKQVGKNTPTDEVKKLEKELAGAKKEFNSLAGEAAKAGKEVAGFGASFAKMAGLIGGLKALKDLGSAIIEVRGRFQDMETSIETLVGKDVAGKIMPQIKEMAKTSPLTMSDIVGAEQTMLSFNIDAEKSIEYLKALSDVSMGSSQKFNSLTLAFSQVASAGKLMGQDLLQMINAGFNPLQQISQKTGKSISELKEQMSKGAISAEMVQQAFIDATSAGGKFYKMSENASKTINGQLSMLEDAWDAALNEIGESSEGVIRGGIEALTSLIENYDKIGKMLATLIATYGAYRVAVSLVSKETSILALKEAALTKVRMLAKKAQDLLNASMLKNPAVLLATVITALVGTMWALSDETTHAERVQDSYNRMQEEAAKKEQEHADAIQKKIDVVRDETQALVDRQAALLALQNEYPHIFAQYDLESIKLADILDIQKKINEEKAKERLTDSARSYMSKSAFNDYLYDEAKDTMWGDRSDEEVYGNVWNNGPFTSLWRWMNAVGPSKLNEAKADAEASRKIFMENLAPYIKKKADDMNTLLLEDLISWYEKGDQTLMFDDKGGLSFVPASDVDALIAKGAKKEQFIAKDAIVLETLKASLQAHEARQKKAAAQTIYGEDYEAAREAWETSKAKLDEIRKDKSKYKTEQYLAAVAEEADLRKKYEKLGGNTKGKDAADDETEEEKKKKRKQEAKDHNSRLERESRERRDRERAAREQEREAVDQANMVEEARINAELEGAEKRRALRARENKKELEGLERQKEDYVEKVVDRERAVFEAEQDALAEANSEYKKQAFDESAVRQKVDTTTYDSVISYTRQRQTKEQDEVVQELLDTYQSYEDKKLDIDKAYEEDRVELQAMYEKTGDEKYRRSLEERYKAYVKALNDLEQEMGTADYKLIFGDPSRMTSATIDKALEAARKKLQSLDKEADPETFKALSEAIERLEDARDSNPFEGWNSGLMGVIQTLYQIRNIRKDIAKYQEEGNKEAQEASEAELQKAKIDLAKSLAATGVSKFGEALSTAASSMRQVAEAAGDMDLMEQAEALEKAGSFVSSVASGAASGGWVGAVVGGVSSLMDMLVQSITKSKVVAAEAKKAYEDYIDELAHSARTINNEDYESIFGVRTLDKVVDAARAAKDAHDDYKDALKSTGDTYSVNNVRRFQDSLQNMLVFEGQGWGTEKKLKNIKTLSEKFTDLFDAEGNLNREEAEAILKAYSKYSGEEWYEALEDATNALNDYEKNLAIVDEYLSSLFSNVGNEIADAIMQGNDALEVLENNAGQIFASIAKEMIVSALISQDFIDRYKEMLRKAVATEGVEDDAETLEGFVQELKGNIDDAKAKWDEIKAIAEAHGLDMDLNSGDQSASRKGYQTLSEDTGNELTGRAIAQYESNLRMEGSMRGMKDSIDLMASNYIQIRDIAAESRAIIANSYLELQQIRDNTNAIIKPIKEMNDKMNTIISNL